MLCRTVRYFITFLCLILSVFYLLMQKDVIVFVEVKHTGLIIIITIVICYYYYYCFLLYFHVHHDKFSYI